MFSVLLLIVCSVAFSFIYWVVYWVFCCAVSVVRCVFVVCCLCKSVGPVVVVEEPDPR